MNWFIWECMSTNKERLYIQNQQIMGHEKKVHIYIYTCKYLQNPPVPKFGPLAKGTKFQPLRIKNTPGSFLEQEECPWKIIP